MIQFANNYRLSGAGDLEEQINEIVKRLNDAKEERRKLYSTKNKASLTLQPDFGTPAISLTPRKETIESLRFFGKESDFDSEVILESNKYAEIYSQFFPSPQKPLPSERLFSLTIIRVCALV